MHHPIIMWNIPSTQNGLIFLIFVESKIYSTKLILIQVKLSQDLELFTKDSDTVALFIGKIIIMMDSALITGKELGGK